MSDLSADIIEQRLLSNNLCDIVRTTLQEINSIAENNGGYTYAVGGGREYDFIEVILIEEILKFKANQNNKVIHQGLFPPLFYPILSTRLKSDGYIVDFEYKTISDSSNEELLAELIQRGVTIAELFGAYSK